MNTDELQLLKQLATRLLNLIGELPPSVNLAETWLDIPETAKWLKVSPRTLQNYRDQGLLPYSQYGAKIYFRLQDLQEFLMKHYVTKNS
jgi:hypothetical protein